MVLSPSAPNPVAVLEPPGSVVKKGEHSRGCVVLTGSITKKGPCSGGRIVVGSIRKERSGADGRVEGAFGVAAE